MHAGKQAWILVTALSLAADGAQDALQKGREARLQGQYEKALEFYEQQRREAEGRGARAQQAEALLHQARAWESWAQEEKDESRRAKAMAYYERAIELGDSQQRLLALNNLSVLLLRLGRPAEALQTARRIELDKIDPAQQYFYRYNLARILEKNGEWHAAYKEYRQVVQEKPRVEAAVEGAYRVLLQRRPPPVQAAVEMGEFLLGQGQAALAARRTLEAAFAWGAEPEAHRLLALWLRCYLGTGKVDPQRFLAGEWPELVKLRAGAPALAGSIDDIGRAFLDFRLLLSRSEASWFFAESSGKPAQAAALSELLQKLGDHYAGRGDPQAALTRYAAAWMLDPLDTDAAVYSAAVLRDHPKLDPHGSLLHQLNSTYRRYSTGGTHAGFDAQDYENLAGLFAILGSIEAQSQRGASGAIDKFRRGLELEKRDGDDPTPGLHLGLAEAYERNGQYAQAFEQYRRAMEGFARDHNAEGAQHARQRAVKLIPNLKGNPQEHQAQLERVPARR